MKKQEKMLYKVNCLIWTICHDWDESVILVKLVKCDQLQFNKNCDHIWFHEIFLRLTDYSITIKIPISAREILLPNTTAIT